jgi:hypothetical protein
VELAEWVAAIIGIAGVVAGVAGALSGEWRKPLAATAAVLVVFAVVIGYRAGVPTAGPNTPRPPETTNRVGDDLSQLRLQYAQRVGPVCARWRSEGDRSGPIPVNPTADVVRVSGSAARIFAAGAAEMRTVPAPRGDEPTVARMINTFERIGYYWRDAGESMKFGSSDLAMKALSQAEKYVELYNHQAEEYGLDGRCLITP